MLSVDPQIETTMHLIVHTPVGRGLQTGIGPPCTTSVTTTTRQDVSSYPFIFQGMSFAFSFFLTFFFLHPHGLRRMHHSATVAPERQWLTILQNAEPRATAGSHLTEAQLVRPGRHRPAAPTCSKVKTKPKPKNQSQKSLFGGIGKLLKTSD